MHERDGHTDTHTDTHTHTHTHTYTHTHTPHDDIGRAYHADSSFDYKLTSSVIIILKIEVPLYR